MFRSAFVISDVQLIDYLSNVLPKREERGQGQVSIRSVGMMVVYEGGYDLTQDVPFIHPDALIKPLEQSTPRRGKEMDECPKWTCNITNYRRRSIHWVTDDCCGQWFHQYCIGLNPSKLKKN